MELFAGTAWHYARYRPGYPHIFFDDLVKRLRLDGTGRLLDLGCGTGQLTIPLAAHIAEAVGVDADPGMLAEAEQQARQHSITNITWCQGTAEALADDLGQFRLVTMGRSFHWMDREHVLNALDETVDDEGDIVIASDGCLIRPTTRWQKAIEDVQRRFLGDVEAHTPTTGIRQRHEEVLAKSPFSQVNRRIYEFHRSWNIEQAIGYLYSTSLPLRRLLGDRQRAFEDEVTSTLLDIDPSGHFTEPVTLEVLIATRR